MWPARTIEHEQPEASLNVQRRPDLSVRPPRIYPVALYRSDVFRPGLVGSLITADLEFDGLALSKKIESSICD